MVFDDNVCSNNDRTRPTDHLSSINDDTYELLVYELSLSISAEFTVILLPVTVVRMVDFSLQAVFGISRVVQSSLSTVIHQ